MNPRLRTWIFGLAGAVLAVVVAVAAVETWSVDSLVRSETLRKLGNDHVVVTLRDGTQTASDSRFEKTPP